MAEIKQTNKMSVNVKKKKKKKKENHQKIKHGDRWDVFQSCF